jgi:hypothetical protein
MSNFEKWKAARAFFYDAMRAYNEACIAATGARDKRGAAWESLVEAATSLSPDEREKAAEYEFGPTNTSGNRKSET